MARPPVPLFGSKPAVPKFQAPPRNHLADDNDEVLVGRKRAGARVFQTNVCDERARRMPASAHARVLASECSGLLSRRISTRASRSWGSRFRFARTTRPPLGWRASSTCSCGWGTKRRTCGSTVMTCVCFCPTSPSLPGPFEPGNSLRCVCGLCARIPPPSSGGSFS
jgi:hypothetical protein